jgi:hypothetical protein
VKNEVRETEEQESIFRVELKAAPGDDIELKMHKIHCYVVLLYDRHSAVRKNLRRS